MMQYEVLRTGAGWIRAIDRRWIGLAGSERAEFLQGLVTNDVVGLSPGGGCYAVHLTPQGRMVADMFVWAEADRLLLDVHESVEMRLRERFDGLIFTEDVTVLDAEPAWAGVDLHGPRAGAVVAAVTGDSHAPMAPFEHRRWRAAGDGARVARTDAIGIEGYRFVAGAAAVDDLVAGLGAAGAVPVDRAAVETVRIESGRPRFPVDMDANTIPLEAGLEDRAIDFDKGCYVGQEVIIRILHRGQGRVARRLVGLALDAGDGAPPAVPSAGATVWSTDGSDIGRITSATVSPLRGGAIALGYVPRTLADAPGTPVAISVGETRVGAVVMTLPFGPSVSRA